MFKSLFLNKIDAYVINCPVNRFYVTRLNTSYGYVVLTESTNFFYTDSRYVQAAKNALADFKVVEVTRANALSSIAADLEAANLKTIGFEDEFLTVSAHKEFKESLKGFTLKAASNVLENLRLVKTVEEINHIKAAQAITEKVFDKVIDGLKPGVTEKELAIQLKIESLKQGAEDMAFAPIVAFGENSANPHHQPTDRRLEKEDLLLIDFGVKFNGYHSDMTRTFRLNEVEDKFKQLYDIVLRAQLYALKHLKAGMTCREADSLAREFIISNGYDTEFSHSLGHGVGLCIHEKPSINKHSDELLLPGMVVSVEPGIYLHGEGGIRIEDMVVIREDGVENLTLTPKEFLV